MGDYCQTAHTNCGWGLVIEDSTEYYYQVIEDGWDQSLVTDKRMI